MTFIKYLLLCFSLFALVSCDTDDGSEGGTEPTDTEVKLMLLNPTNEAIEARFYDSEGWSYKFNIPANSADTVSIEADSFSVGSKLPNGEYLTSYPPYDTPISYGLNYSNMGIDVNAETGDTSVRFVFEPNIWYSNKDGQPMYKGMYFIDLSFDSTNIYALGELRWVYGNDEDIALTPTSLNNMIQKTEKEGYPLVMKAFRGTMPKIIPSHSKLPQSPISEAINVSYGIKGSIPKLYQMPDSVGSSNVRNFVYNEILREILL